MKYTSHTSGRSREDSGGSSGSGSGRFKNFLHRSKQDRPASSPVMVDSPSVSSPAPKHYQEQQKESKIRETSLDHLQVTRRGSWKPQTGASFQENPPITASPGGTPPKKTWEGAYNTFLRGNKHSHNVSPTLSSTFERTLPTAGSQAILMPHSPSHSGKTNENVKSSFLKIPGTKRLVSRSSLHSPKKDHRIFGFEQLDTSQMPSFPNLIVPSPTTSNKNSLDEHVHEGVSSANAPVSSGDEGSVRGGRLFRSVFTGDGIVDKGTCKAGDGLDSFRHRRSHKSMDELDLPLRKGIQRSCSHSLSPAQASYSSTNELLFHTTNQVEMLNRKTENSDPKLASLDELLASAASTPSTQRMMMPRGPRRASSSGGKPQSTITEGVMHSIHALRPLHSRSKSHVHFSYPCEFEFHHHYPSQEYMTTQKIPESPQESIVPFVPRLPDNLQWTSSNGSQNVGLTLDDSDRSETDNGNRAVTLSERSWGEILEPDVNRKSTSLLATTTAEYLPSSPSRVLQTTEDVKKVFTRFHNASEFTHDSTSAFLGGRNSSNLNLIGTHDLYLLYQEALPRIAGDNIAHSGGRIQDLDTTHSSLRLETVDEQDISIHKGLRLLKPVQGTDAWQTGRRYLIVPAVLSSCPLTAVNKLAGSRILPATEALSTENLPSLGLIDLGEALMTYVRESQHLCLGKWSSCRLALRQNFLLEFDAASPIKSVPRGYAHLQHAVAYPHSDFGDIVELRFYASPCAKSDLRSLRIQVQNRSERDLWIKCLNDAANLRIEDIWDVDRAHSLGNGRYASIFPAKRRFGNSKPSENQCALKIVDKNEFWRRVVKGRERADTLVRELAVQATMTAKCGNSVPSFLQLRGCFETSDHVVIELELLEGKDLFEHIQSKGTVEEKDAGLIFRDLLTALDGLNRIGLAHRDVKPANILMSNRRKCGASVKLGDFGMSTFVGVDGLVRGRCGTPGYVAPEILNAGARTGYGNKVDVFSAGVTLYLMLSGVEPFYGETEEELVFDNSQAKITFPHKYWDNVSAEAKDLVVNMLRADPSGRLSAKEALDHPFFAKVPKCHNQEISVDPAEEGVCAIM